MSSCGRLRKRERYLFMGTQTCLEDKETARRSGSASSPRLLLHGCRPQQLRKHAIRCRRSIRRAHHGSLVPRFLCCFMANAYDGRCLRNESKRPQHSEVTDLSRQPEGLVQIDEGRSEVSRQFWQCVMCWPSCWVFCGVKGEAEGEDEDSDSKGRETSSSDEISVCGSFGRCFYHM